MTALTELAMKNMDVRLLVFVPLYLELTAWLNLARYAVSVDLVSNSQVTSIICLQNIEPIYL